MARVVRFFLSNVHAAHLVSSLQMIHLKTLVPGNAKEVIAALGFTEDMYEVTGNIQVFHFEKTVFGGSEEDLYLYAN